jgi:uncharacterized protein
MTRKKTLIIGASTNSERYAYKAAQKLIDHGHEIYLLGNKPGELFGQNIVNEQIDFSDIDTITLYLSAKNQSSYINYIKSLKPRRVIFNPGTENPDFYAELQSNQIEVEEACTLVLLATQSY